MGSRLDIDPDGVRGAGGVVQQAPTRGTPPSAVTPAAADATSVSVAAQLGALMATLGVNTTVTNARTEVASGRLTSSADTYQEQDTISARALGNTHAGAAPAHFADVQMPNFAAPRAPSMPAAVPAGGGIVPVTGHEIATVVHGGPGPQGLDDAATALKALAGQLEQAATTVRSGRSQAASSWSSDAADNADNHLSGLERRYQDHAEQARTGASQASAHAANFRQFKADTPQPSVFTDLERRLYAANNANAQPGSMGRYSATITELQTKLADANRKAITAFGQYTAAAETHPVSSLGQPPGPADAPPPAGAADPGADTAGSDMNTSAALDDPNADPALLDDATGTGAEMLQTVLPAVLGGISGAVGAGVGAVSGAAQKLQEVGSQAVGGLTQGMSTLTSAASASAPKLGGSDGSGDSSGLPDFGSGGGGGLPGDTEPASSTLSEPLSPPAVTAATSAPVVAAPATVSASTPSTAGSPMGVGGGGMVPPMMGAPMGGRGGGAEEDKRLAPDRRLHIEEAPNAEPVKGRREARARRGDTEKQ
ncbi:PPE domain-containing protein [Mycobacterium sp. 48b]|uniref:PPE domain-containing protein n=1 Tax=Mycobacterium sp. 48b TaxID=3400426 RepID=UPI003AAD7A97